MMIECPKCGFSQPQDQYCAKCGVDMENFKPSAPPVTQQIFSNPLVHLALAFVLVCLVILFLRKHSREQLVSRMQFLKGGPTLVARPQAPDNNKEASPPPPPPPPPATHVAAMSPMTNQDRPTDSSDEGKKTFGDSVQMHLVFAEVDHQTMENLRQDSRATGQFTEFGDFKAGALPANRKASGERGVRILYKSDEKLDHDHMSASSTAGEAKADGSFLGITYSVSLTHIDATEIRGEIEVLQNFHESPDLNDPPVRRTYPSTTFELTPGQGWMVTLNLPYFLQDDPESASNAGSDGIMRIFQSPQYKSRQTEFTLFFEFDKPAATPNAGKNNQ